MAVAFIAARIDRSEFVSISMFGWLGYWLVANLLLRLDCALLVHLLCRMS